MKSKPERFELRLEADTLDEIDAWRARQRDLPTRSEAIRRLIYVNLKEENPKYTRIDNNGKIIIWLLTKLIEILVSKNNHAIDLHTINLIQKILIGGNFWALASVIPGIVHNSVDDPRNVDIVFDILDAWNSIERAVSNFDVITIKRIKELSRYPENEIKFSGFWANKETEFYGIANFIINDLGLFESFKGRSLDSHGPRLAYHIKINDRYRSVRKSSVAELTEEQVIDILRLI